MTAVIKLGSSLILTRLLNPEAYGIFAILFSFLFMIELMSDVGTIGLLIRHPRGSEVRFVHTVWTVRLIRCAFNFCLIFFGAPVIAAVYQTPVLTSASSSKRMRCSRDSIRARRSTHSASSSAARSPAFTAISAPTEGFPTCWHYRMLEILIHENMPIFIALFASHPTRFSCNSRCPCAHTSKPSSRWLSSPPLIDTVSPSAIRGQIKRCSGRAAHC